MRRERAKGASARLKPREREPGIEELRKPKERKGQASRGPVSARDAVDVTDDAVLESSPLDYPDEYNRKPPGTSESDRRQKLDRLADEASEASFPASDPPSTTASGVGGKR